MTTGIINGRLWTLHSNAVAITHLKSLTVNQSGETIDVTSHDSSGWKDKLMGDKSWSMDVEFWMDFSAAGENIDELEADWNSGTSQTVLATTAVQGDSTVTGSAFITSISKSGSTGDAVSVSVTYEGTGALTIGTVA
jgi:predicted secreted protein